jgi:hypothetical protein
MWYVFLTKKAPPDFALFFFPRKYKYKKDAERLVEEVKRRGSDAKVVKEPKITAKQEGGDDGYCYVIRIEGERFADGLTRTEIPYFKQRALQVWQERQARAAMTGHTVNPGELVRSDWEP